MQEVSDGIKTFMHNFYKICSFVFFTACLCVHSSSHVPSLFTLRTNAHYLFLCQHRRRLFAVAFIWIYMYEGYLISPCKNKEDTIFREKSFLFLNIISFQDYTLSPTKLKHYDPVLIVWSTESSKYTDVSPIISSFHINPFPASHFFKSGNR